MSISVDAFLSGLALENAASRKSWPRELHAVVATHRNATAAIVAHLGEVEERRLHLRRGFPSMFQYCVTELAFSEDEACRRIDAARLARRFPRILAMLEAGTLSLSVAGLLKEHLTEANAAELFDRVAGCSARRAKEWIAARFPLPDVPEMIRALPQSRAVERAAPVGPSSTRRSRWLAPSARAASPATVAGNSRWDARPAASPRRPELYPLRGAGDLG
jgi:hypothetical protein